MKPSSYRPISLVNYLGQKREIGYFVIGGVDSPVRPSREDGNQFKPTAKGKIRVFFLSKAELTGGLDYKFFFGNFSRISVSTRNSYSDNGTNFASANRQ